jgi:hypothetical protein
MNSAYKHLDTKLRIAELTVGQWVGVAAGVMLMVIYGKYVSPFGEMLTVLTAIYLGGIPIAAVFLSSMVDFDLLLLLRTAIRWRRLDGRFLPGPGAATDGYRVTESQEVARQGERGHEIAELDVAALWGEQ